MTDFIVELLKTKDRFDAVMMMICKFLKKSNSFSVKKLKLLFNELKLILLSQLTEIFSQYELTIEISNDFQNFEHSCLAI